MGASVSGIFGKDPYEIALRSRQQFLAPITQASNPYEKIGAALGTLAGGALFNIQDPELKKAGEITKIFNDIVGTSDPTQADYGTKLSTLATTLAQAGYGREAAVAAAEANKYNTAARAEARAERSLTIQEEEAKRKVETTERPVSVGTTIKGLNTYRKGSGSQIYVIDEEGKEAEYDPKKHGRYETAEDRIKPSGVQIRDIPGPGGVGIIGREIYDNQGNVIRREYLPGYGPNAAPRAGQPSRPAAPGQPAAAPRQPQGSSLAERAKAELERRKNAAKGQ